MVPIVRYLRLVAIGLGFLVAGNFQPGFTQTPPKDQAQIQPEPEAAQPDKSQEPPNADTEPSSEMSLGDIPEIQTVELTAETARKAVDAFMMVRDKYANTPIYEYEDLQEFVDKTDDGKRLEADIKTYGFATVTEWNTAVTTVGLAYSALSDDPANNVGQQIAEIKADNNLAQDMKDRMVKSLSAMIPSENNKKVVNELAKDSAYAEKLKLLSEEE